MCPQAFVGVWQRPFGCFWDRGQVYLTALWPPCGVDCLSGSKCLSFFRCLAALLRMLVSHRTLIIVHRPADKGSYSYQTHVRSLSTEDRAEWTNDLCGGVLSCFSLSPKLHQVQHCLVALLGNRSLLSIWSPILVKYWERVTHRTEHTAGRWPQHLPRWVYYPPKAGRHKEGFVLSGDCWRRWKREKKARTALLDDEMWSQGPQESDSPFSKQSDHLFSTLY